MHVGRRRRRRRRRKRRNEKNSNETLYLEEYICNILSNVPIVHYYFSYKGLYI